MKKLLFALLSVYLFSTCDPQREKETVTADLPFIWENANIYFLLTDRFYNGDLSNDLHFDRNENTAVLRGFEGGDIKGITKKIKDGYFSDLGITAIWFTPVVEQVHGLVDEGSGKTYGYHGYWAKDWTALDPNFGTGDDLAELVSTAHRHGIRIVLDVVANHTGPVTEKDPVWPSNWVRTTPTCTYTDYASTVECTLVANLPDLRTDREMEVPLPQVLLDKWKEEGRLEKELRELDDFFARTGYPRAPKYYVIKWITDYIRKYGIDAFRVDTAKHTEAELWAELYQEAAIAFEAWKKSHREDVLDETPFFMFGEVYGYQISAGRWYDYGDCMVDFFDYGFQSLINFEFKGDAHQHYESVFSKYSKLLHNELAGKTVVNYLSSHDDGDPFDKMRENPIESATKLLLCPGISQVYYGDESSRPLAIDDASGDATLRSFMNWDEIQANADRGGFAIGEVLAHWQKLGRFRAGHPAVGAGRHQMLSSSPYVFARSYEGHDYKDQVCIGLDLPVGLKRIDVAGVFADGTQVTDQYSGQLAVVQQGKVSIDSEFAIVLLAE
ncbi:MAG: alpha-amylase [Cyclobacteriaceae bacterium]|nr:alpha-amylase [Cyclobacteriaceae bacterium]